MAKPKPDPFEDIQPDDVTTTGPAAQPDGSQDILPGAAARAITDKAAGTDIRTLHQAREWAFDQVRQGAGVWEGLCLAFTRSCYNVDPLYPDARTAWLEADSRHRADRGADVPNGKPVHWDTSSEHDHIAFSIGKGRCISSDVRAPGQVNVVRIDDITQAWGATLRGWTGDINGEDVPAPRKNHKPRLTTAFKIRMVRQAITHARSAGNHTRVIRLRAWLRKLRSNR